MPETRCDQFERLVEFAGIFPPELIAAAALEVPALKCKELCGAVGEKCLAALKLRQQGLPAEPPTRSESEHSATTPGITSDEALSESSENELLRTAAGSIDVFFNEAANPQIARYKAAMSERAARFNESLAQGIPILPTAIEEYRVAAKSFWPMMKAFFNGVNFMKMRGGNLVVKGLFRMIVHRYKNKIHGCEGLALLELDEISDGKIPESRTFKDYFAKLPLLNIAPEELRPEPDDIATTVACAAVSFEVEELRLVAAPITLIRDIPINGAQGGRSFRALIHSRVYDEVVMEVLGNAAQAMLPEGGTLTVGVHRTDTHVVTTISDTGPGIPPEHLGKIFDPLFTTKPNGTGRGLALAQEYIEGALGGTITVESIVGQGSKFSISVPVVNG